MEFIFWIGVVLAAYCVYAVVDGYVREEQRIKRIEREYDTSHW